MILFWKKPQPTWVFRFKVTFHVGYLTNTFATETRHSVASCEKVGYIYNNAAYKIRRANIFIIDYFLKKSFFGKEKKIMYNLSQHNLLYWELISSSM